MLTNTQRIKRINPTVVYSISFSVIIIFTYYSYFFLFEAENEIGTIPFITANAFKQIFSLSKIHFNEIPIVVYYPYVLGVNPGGMSEYPDNWISAIIGKHYKYLGDASALTHMRETPFDDIYSKYYSYYYIKQMIYAGVWKPSEIIKHPIVVIDNFYKVEPIDRSSNYNRIGYGVYAYKYHAHISTNYRIDVLGSTIKDNAPWYTRNLTIENKNYTMIESFTRSDTTNKLFKTRIYIDQPGCNELSLRYLDGPGWLGFRIWANGQVLGTQYYENTEKIRERIFTLCTPEGWVLVSIEPISKPLVNTGDLYISLVNTATVNKAIS
jgi:hypothetical protein